MSKIMKLSCLITATALLIQIVMLWNFWPQRAEFEKPQLRQEEGTLEFLDLGDQILAALTEWRDRSVPSAMPLPHLVMTEGATTGLFPEVLLRGTSCGKGRSIAVIDIPGVATGLVVQRGVIPGSDLVVIEIGFDFIDLDWQGRRRRFQLDDGRDKS